jgi:hypothetical protein
MWMPVASADDVSLGRRLYEQGLRANGEPVQAVGAGEVRLVGAEAACVTCHRRSGLGGREGTAVVPPVIGPILFSKPKPLWLARSSSATATRALRHEDREAYDAPSLRRVIQLGIDASERPLGAFMPRYDLDDADAAALSAFLKQFGSQPVPGLEAGVIELATVVTPDADAVRAQTVVDGLQRWAESQPLQGLRIQLQVWQLQGLPADWTQQLNARYRQHPVFAVLSGAGGSRWQPVRDFCESAGVPCVFPIVDLAPDDNRDRFTMYLSRGVPLEARLLGRFLRDAPAPGRRVIQLVGGEAGQQAAPLLAHASGISPLTFDWPSPAALDALSGLRPGDVLVAWLDVAQFDALVRAAPSVPHDAMIVLSAQLAPPARAGLPAGWQGPTRWISVKSDPTRLQGQAALGLTPWLRRVNWVPADLGAAAEVYAAVHFFSDSLARMRLQWSREHLLESLEATNFARPAAGGFFSLSLGPGQREAANSGRLLAFEAPEFQRLVPVGPTLQP